MRKFFVITIPIVAMVLFILIMLSGNVLKKPLGNNDNIPEAIQLVIQTVKDEKWEEASNNTEQLSETWKKIVNRVQFSSERDEINAFSMNLARLRGAIIAKDKSGALMELSEAYEHWDELGK
jgi:hypothetical protein